MKVLRTVLTGLFLVLPAIAVAQDVKIDFDKSFDFSPVKTYSIKLGTTWGNDLSERRVMTEFDEAIAAKGWKKVDEAKADIHVVLHGASKTKRDATTFYSGGMGGYGYRYGGMGMGTASTVVNEYSDRHGRRGHVRPEVKEPRVPRHRRGRDLGQRRAKREAARQGVDEDVQGLPPGGKKEISV